MCTVWKISCSCAQYTFLMYRLESVLFLCTVHISDAQLCVISLSNRIPRSVARGFVLFVLLPCDCNVVKTVLVPVETVTGNLFPCECDKKCSHYIRCQYRVT